MGISNLYPKKGRHVIWYDMKLYDMTWHDMIYNISCRAMSCHVMPCHVMSCLPVCICIFILLVTGEEYFVIWIKIRTLCKADTFVHILWNAKHISMQIKNDYLIKLDHSNFCILINPVTDKLVRNTSSPDRNELKTELMLARMKKNIFRLISTIILPAYYICITQ